MANPNSSHDPAAGSGNTVNTRLMANFADDPLAGFDGRARLVLSLILDGDNWPLLAWHTGVVRRDRVLYSPEEQKKAPPERLPLVLTLDREALPPEAITQLKSVIGELGLLGALYPAWMEEFGKNQDLKQIPVELPLDPFDPSQTPTGISVEGLLKALAKLGVGIAIPAHHGPALEQSLGDLGLPRDTAYPDQVRFRGVQLTGKNVVIGIVDDGCPFAHRDFLVDNGKGANPRYRARVISLLDQSQDATPEDIQAGWKAVSPHGRVLDGQAIENAIQKLVDANDGCFDERAVYQSLRYPIDGYPASASHGARVMGIAAGNGKSVLGWPGVAPEADLVFVQLSPTLIDYNPSSLGGAVMLAINHVFAVAGAAGKPAVVNVSYGGYSGAHDGTSEAEAGIDALLAIDGRAVVVSAGNGFEADCHASGRLMPFDSRTRTWILRAEDPTFNGMELWYGGDANLWVWLVPPAHDIAYGPFAQGSDRVLRRPGDNAPIGRVVHSIAANGDAQVVVWLNPTNAELLGKVKPPVVLPAYAPAAPGAWLVALLNLGTKPADFHAWIQRDDVAPGNPQRQQSRFPADQADPRNTIGDLATGARAVSVGAHNATTQEAARYSAAGPTRPTKGNAGRTKPEVCAPGEELRPERGVLATASTRAQPARLNGTSASAPHVAGMIALMFEYAPHHSAQKVYASQIVTALRDTGLKNALRASFHNGADDTRVAKQKDFLADVEGGGKARLEAAMEALFPQQS